jgi:HlyD family secretion protein
MTKLILIIISTLVVTVVAGASIWNSQSQSRAGSTGQSERVRVQRARFERSLIVSGEISPVRAIRISVPRTRIWGQMAIQAMAPEGSLVQAGDVLAQIDNAQLITSLNTEQINLEKAENDFAKKQSELDVQLKDLEMELSTRELEMEKTKLKAEISKDLLSLRDWQDNQFNYQKANKEFDKIKQKIELIRKASAEDLALAQVKREQSQSRIKIMQNDLDSLQIKSPVAGTVLYENAPMNWNRNENDPPRKFQVADQVWPGMILLSVIDLTEMEVRAFVSEVDGGLVRAGQSVRVNIDSHANDHFTGTVDFVPEVAERLRRLSNVRVFVTRIKLDRSDPNLMKPGMSVRAEIIVDEREGLVLPREAVSADQGKSYVVHASRGKTEVNVLSRNVTSCLVDGLQEGDEIITK